MKPDSGLKTATGFRLQKRSRDLVSNRGRLPNRMPASPPLLEAAAPWRAFPRAACSLCLFDIPSTPARARARATSKLKLSHSPLRWCLARRIGRFWTLANEQAPLHPPRRHFFVLWAAGPIESVTILQTCGQRLSLRLRPALGRGRANQ